MNLRIDHARVFRRTQRIALILYISVIAVCAVWGMVFKSTLDAQALLLKHQVQQLKTDPLSGHNNINKKDNQTMETVKNHLTHLFSVPLPGISFSVLSLDETGMHVRGRARTAASLDKWLSHVSEAFSVEMHTSETRSGRELNFEVLLHEKP